MYAGYGAVSEKGLHRVLLYAEFELLRVLADLLYTVKQFLADDRLLHIRNDLLLLYGVADLLVNFEADRCTFEVYSAPGVRSIFKNVLYSCP